MSLGINKISILGTAGYGGLPEGIIIGLASGYSTNPSFSVYSTADGRFALGGTTSGVTGGSYDIATTSASGGSHNPEDNWVFMRQPGGSAGAAEGQNYFGGSHSHSTTHTVVPKKARLKLIQANSPNAKPPVGAVMFGSSSSLSSIDSDLSALNDQSAYLFFDSTTGVSSISGSAVTDTKTFSHTHHSLNNRSTAIVENANAAYLHGNNHPSKGPSHSHTGLLSYTTSVKAKILKAFYRVSEDMLINDGAIGMWDGAGAPAGWAVCDGTNGTIDLVDYFVKLGTTGIGGAEGDNTCSGSGTSSSAGTHNHAISSSGSNGWAGRYSHQGNHSHSHDLSFTNQPYTPEYRTIKFIQKVS